MSNNTLRDKVEQLFEFSLSRTANRPALANFHRTLFYCQQRLHQPMRVAIVGLIKAGKSTMMNALLGEAVVATGTVEATFNVNVLQYGDSPSLLVHFKNDRPPEPKSFQQLQTLTLRADENRDYLLSIKYIEVNYPNLLLKTFKLIDTPGLESFYKDDSENTLKFLQLHGNELTEITQAEAANADAVLYLFSHSISTQDAAIVEQFQGPGMGQATPINAIGVLTKVDAYSSDPNVSDPMEAGRKITRRLSAHPQVQNLLYTIYPVCGLLALGAQTLKPDEFQTLMQLAALPEERFDRLIRTAERFAEKPYENEPEIPPVVKRQQVLNRLGLYGISLACQLIRQGVNSQQNLTKELLQRSGVPELRDLITSHFGNRAFIIKLGTVLRQIAVTRFQEQQRLGGTDWEIFEEIAGKFEALEAQEHSFHELQVLRSYYENNLDFTEEEAKQLLEVTGEYGVSFGSRLGLGESATVAQMLPVAEERMNYWYQLANDAIGVNGQTTYAAGVLARSYERILYHVTEAKKHLYL